MIDALKLIWPFSYALKTRFNSRRALLFSGYFEWLAALLVVLAYATSPPLEAALRCVAQYLAFIAIYEIGYICNDLLAYREDAPRSRASGLGVTPNSVVLWVVVRVVSFVAITLALGLGASMLWWLHFACLAAAFTMHNVLNASAPRVLTFWALATLRWTAPVVTLLPNEIMHVVVPAISINYVLFRTLAYMDSKQLLDMPERRGAGFKVWFYALASITSGYLSVVYGHVLPLLMTLYYGVFVVLFWLKTRLGQG